MVEIGGDKLTHGLAEALNVSYSEAESRKVGKPQEVESALVPLLTPLGRELRASIDFFEHQSDKTIGSVFLSGAAANSDFFSHHLQQEMMTSFKRWNPVGFMEPPLGGQQLAELEQTSPLLVNAIGAAMGAFQ